MNESTFKPTQKDKRRFWAGLGAVCAMYAIYMVIYPEPHAPTGKWSGLYRIVWDNFGGNNGLIGLWLLKSAVCFGVFLGTEKDKKQ